MYRKYIKRIIDFVVALSVLFVLMPVLIIVTLLLFFINGGKPFFFQVRPGENEKLFKIIKFKTMNDKKDAEGNLLPDSRRLTKVGSFIRKTSLDEIPQLINVLIGDMSLIGPRPLLKKYLPYYSEREALRHTVKPGITGLAQINGRNTLKWDDRLEMDVLYVQKVSFFNDLYIAIKTIKNVLASKDLEVDPTTLMKDLHDERAGKSM